MLIIGSSVFLLIVIISIVVVVSSSSHSNVPITSPPTTMAPTTMAPTTVPPSMEVYQVPGGYDYKYSQAEGVCNQYGASVATSAQLSNAQSLGAEWCSAGWVSDSLTAQYPMQSSQPGCGSAGINNYITATSANDTNTSASVNCFGTKPQGMKMFNASKYYM